MRISAIVAMSENRVIGKNNQLPWHLPADLKHFKAVTMGKPILMGRKTYESIGRLLPGRQNIIITRNPGFHVEGATIVHSIAEGLQAAGMVEEVMVIGGAELFREMLPLCYRLYLTIIHTQIEGDSFFPELSPDWVEVANEFHAADQDNPFAYRFLILDKKAQTNHG
ncbi:MAG TPA: type 3 dihydrofolate reductase [Gammaproteobacteria bacterium]|nr:type 3 dihydrofolate reductase [Gammaproteobacteria bacterium]